MSKEQKDMIEATERLKKALTGNVAASLGADPLKAYLQSQGDYGFELQVIPEGAITDPRVYAAQRIILPWEEGDPVNKSLRESCSRCGYMKLEGKTCGCVSSQQTVSWFEDK